jgi:hypothetical protein
MTAIDSTVGNALNPANLVPARQLSTSKPLANVLAPITDTLSGALAGTKPKPSLLSQFTAPFKVVFNALKALVAKGGSLLGQGAKYLHDLLAGWVKSARKPSTHNPKPPVNGTPALPQAANAVTTALSEAVTKLPTL